MLAFNKVIELLSICCVIFAKITRAPLKQEINFKRHPTESGNIYWFLCEFCIHSLEYKETHRFSQTAHRSFVCGCSDACDLCPIDCFPLLVEHVLNCTCRAICRSSIKRPTERVYIHFFVAALKMLHWAISLKKNKYIYI